MLHLNHLIIINNNNKNELNIFSFFPYKNVSSIGPEAILSLTLYSKYLVPIGQKKKVISDFFFACLFVWPCWVLVAAGEIFGVSFVYLFV